jgi:SulP family sulfate permease
MLLAAHRGICLYLQLGFSLAGWGYRDIPAGLPKPVIPIPLFNLDLITVGIAAIIGLVQGAGVSLGYTNPDGKYPDVSRDFVGQGIANLAVGLFQGLPVGGSLSSTALVVSSGAKTRLANIFTGLFAILAVLLFAPMIEVLPMAGLAAILVIAGVQSINLPRIETVWQTGLAARGVMIFTFIATLALPIQNAVFLGVFLSILVYVFRAAERVEISEIVPWMLAVRGSSASVPTTSHCPFPRAACSLPVQASLKSTCQ